MKVLFVVFSTLLLAQAFAQQTPPGDILGCFGSVVAEAEQSDREDMQAWAADVRDTTQRLRAQRQRCDDLPRDDPPTALQERSIQLCMTAYNLTLANETNRLINELQVINPELAAELRETAPICLGRDPAEVAGRLRRVLMNVL